MLVSCTNACVFLLVLMLLHVCTLGRHVCVVLCVTGNPYRACGNEHVLMVPVGLATILVTGEAYMVLICTEHVRDPEDNWSNLWNT